MPERVSVVVPARNEAAHISRCLKALAEQEPMPGKDAPEYSLEIIVVENGSTDGTPELVRQYIAEHSDVNVRLLVVPVTGRGAARAAGFAAARGQYLLSTDSDTVVPKQWVAQIMKILSENRLIAVTGTCRITNCAPGINRAFNWFQPASMRLYRILMGHWWLTGSNFGIQRDAYELSGGFNPDCRDMEDIDLGWRVYRLGRIGRLPRTVVVTTSGDRFKAGLMRGLFPYMRAYIGRFWLRQGGRYDRVD